jgi:hypothetical protein
MFCSNFKLFDYKISHNYYKNVFQFSFNIIRFQILFTGRSFLEVLLNKKINFSLFLEKLLKINEFHFENVYYIKNCLRKKFIILNSFVQCDIFSSYNIFYIIQYRKSLFYENFFQSFTTNLNKISKFSFFHKSIHGKTLFDVFNFFHYLSCGIIKANCLYPTIINFLNIIENIKKNISKIKIKKEVTLYNIFKNNGNILELYLNHNKLKKFLFYNTHIFYLYPGFFTFIRIYNPEMDSFFSYFILSFTYILENLRFLFENNESKISQVFLYEEYTNFFNSPIIELNINYLIIIIQILVNSSSCEQIVSIIKSNYEINSFNYFTQKNKHFLIKLLFKKIKFNFFLSK